MSSPTAESVQTVLEEAKTNGVCFPPSDLYSNEPPLESDLHRDQISLLIRLLQWHWQERQDFYVSGNITIYYSPHQRKSEDFRGPDFFVVLDTERKPRKSWAVWEEKGKYPNVIIELLSDSTAKTDRGLKKQIYQDTFRTPDYFWFDPNTLELKGFHLLDGQYQDLQPNEQGQLWSQQLNLYLGVHNRELRFFTPDGQLIPTPEESAQVAEATAEVERQRAEAERQRAEAERQRAEAERQRAEAEQQRSERLAEKLRALGIDPDAEA
jgi:Uma2 family endonuclease